MVKIKNNYDENGWVQADGYQTGTKMKTLIDKQGMKTALLKLPRDFQMETHLHVDNEQHIVLEGEYESEGEVYSSGTFRFIQAHEDHGPFGSKSGSIILVMWTKLN